MCIRDSFNGAEGSTRFEDNSLIVKALPKEGKVTAAIDRDGRLTRYSYQYDPSGNQIGTYQMTEKSVGRTLATEFSGEVRDAWGRVIKQVSDNGQVTYFTYELDEFGNIKRTYVHDSPPETVPVRKNLLQTAASDAVISLRPGPIPSLKETGRTISLTEVWIPQDTSP